MTPNITLRDATFDEDAISCWRDWRRFLELRTALLETRAAPTAQGREPAFERDSPETDRETSLQAQLNAIPIERRKVFERSYEERRSEVYTRLEADARSEGSRRRLPDPDEVERLALAELLADADGLDATGLRTGIGAVPLEDGWYEIELAKIDDLPNDSTYRIGNMPDAEQRRRKLATCTIVGLGALAMIWMIFLRNPARADAERPTVVTVNEQAAQAWTPRALIVTFADGSTTTLPVVGEAVDDTPAAIRRGDSLWPLRLCLPQAILAQTRSMRLLSAGDAPTRLYSPREETPGADLLLDACDGDLRRGAVLQTTEPPPESAVGAPATISQGPSITLRELVALGPGDDPTLPAGQVSVVVHATSDGAIDWPALDPTLLLMGGQVLRPVATTPISEGVALRYAVPTFTRPLEIAWDVTDQAGQTLRWRASLQPPIGRAEVLASRLAVRISAGAIEQETLPLSITVRNRDTRPLALMETDLIITQDGERMPPPPLPALQIPLAAGEERVLEIALPLSEGRALTIALGDAVVRIDP